MARYAIIVGGSVLNVIEADLEAADAYAAREGGTAVPSATAGPGDSYDGNEFARPTPPAPPLPDEVETYKAHLVLITAGHFDAVEAIIDGMQPAARAQAQAMFYRRPTIRRLSPLTLQIQQTLGMSDEERDALFAQAAALQA